MISQLLITNKFKHFSCFCHKKLNVMLYSDQMTIVKICIIFIFAYLFDKPIICTLSKISDFLVSYNLCYFTLHNILLHKSNQKSWMFYGKFADEGDNMSHNTNIYMFV